MVRRWSALALLILCLALPSPRPSDAAITRPPTTPLAALDADGTWQEYGALADQFLPLWYDAAGDRLVSLGDWEPGAHAFTFGGSSGWQTLRGMPANVYPNHGNTAWDEVTGVAYVLSSDGATQALWRVTTGASVTATPVVATGPAPAVRPYALVRFDHQTQRLFVVGGVEYSQTPTADDSCIYVLQMGSAPTWTRLGPRGLGPYTGSVGSMFADLVVDEARRRLILFGAHSDSVYTMSIDTPTSWTAVPVSSSSMSPETSGLALDRAGDQVLSLDLNGQAWTFSLARFEWTLINPSGGAPAPRRWASLAIDGSRHRLLAEGGRLQGSQQMTPSNELWALSLDGTPAWTSLVPNAPRPDICFGGFGGYDSKRDRLVFLGGSSYPVSPMLILQDVWVLDVASQPAWSVLPTPGVSPDRSLASSAYDPVRDQMVIFGGQDPYKADLADVATLSFAGTTPAWSAIAPAGTGPSARSSASLVYDSSRDRFLMMFGRSGNTQFSDLWELRLSPAPAWRQLSPAGEAPVPPIGSIPVYDPVGDRVIVQGGAISDTLDAPTWSLDLAAGDGTWHKLAVTQGPSWRHGALSVYDALRKRMLLFGGTGFTSLPPAQDRVGRLNDAWALDLSSTPTWHELAPTGDMPAARYSSLGAYDPANDRLVMTGGLNSGLTDTWTLTFGGTPTATDVALATRDVASDHVTLVWDGGAPGSSATAYRRTGDALWQSLGTLGCDGLGRFTLTDRDIVPGTQLQYRLGLAASGGERFVGTTIVDVPALELAMRTGLTADRRVLLTLQLPAAGTARLALYDVSGRRIWNRNVDATASGTQAVRVDAPGLGQGLYFARMQWGHEVRRARVALVR